MAQNMVKSDESKEVLSFEKIEVLNGNQSKYIKPHRIHYTLVCNHFITKLILNQFVVRQNGKSMIWDCMKVHDR